VVTGQALLFNVAPNEGGAIEVAFGVTDQAALGLCSVRSLKSMKYGEFTGRGDFIQDSASQLEAALEVASIG
jgi:hypothetical protein